MLRTREGPAIRRSTWLKWEFAAEIGTRIDRYLDGEGTGRHAG